MWTDDDRGPDQKGPEEANEPFWKSLQPSKDDIITYALAIAISLAIRECALHWQQAELELAHVR